MPLDEFLQRCLRIYQAQYRRSHYPLLFTVAIEQGEVKEIANSAYEAFWQQTRDPTGEDMGVPILTALESEELARQLEIVEEELARLNHRILETSDQVEALDDEKDDAIRSGAVLGRTSSSGGRRRPRQPFPWIVLGYTAIVSMTLCEAYQLGQPFLDWMGIDTTNLRREWLRNSLGVLSGAGFAIASATGLFLLWHIVFRSAASVFKSWQSEGPVMTALRVGGIFGLCCSLLVGTYVLANMRHGLTGAVLRLLETQQGQQSGDGIGQSVFLFLTLLVPCAAAYIHHQIGQSTYWVRRRDITLKQEQWDRQNEERVLAAEQLADRRALRQQQRERLERQRTLLQNQRQALAQHAQAAQRTQLERLEQARRSTEVYARSLLAALEQDRYYFIRVANRLKMHHLVPDQVQRRAKAQSQPPLPFVHALLPAGNNGHGD